MMYEVDDIAGFPFLIGPDLLGFKRKVEKRLGKITIAGQIHPYDDGTFLYNVQCVGEDIEFGRISEPQDQDGWVEAVVTEFLLNLEHGLKSEARGI